MMFDKLTSGARSPKSSVGDSPAKTSRLPAPALGSVGPVRDCGSSSQGSFGFCGPRSSSSKTSPRCACEACASFSKGLPRAGMMRSGIVYPLQPAAPRTAAIGSSWSRGEYPTPTATEYGSAQNEGVIPHKRPSNGTPSLSTWTRGWPTPLARDGRGPRTSERNNAHPGTSLTDATCRSGRPLPTTCTHGGPCRPMLNPRFVEWLMGFPIGWTDCEPSETQLFLW